MGGGRMRACVLGTFGLVVVGALGCEKGASDNNSPSLDQSSTRSASTSPVSMDAANEESIVAPSPSSSLRAFFHSLFTSDRAQIESLIIPNADAHVLWDSNVPPEQPAAVEALVKELTCRQYTVGESMLLPNGKSLVLEESMTSQDRLWFEVKLGGVSEPILMLVERKEGEWKVDAGAIIAGRIAAQRLRDRASP